MAMTATANTADRRPSIDSLHAYVELWPYAANLARSAAGMALHPKVKVGAVALGVNEQGDAKLFAAANQNLGSGENPTKVCAEPIAMQKAVHHGYRQIRGLWISGTPQPDTHSGIEAPFLPPCGNCRELIGKPGKRTDGSLQIDPDIPISLIHPEEDEYSLYLGRELLAVYEGEDGHLPLPFSHHIDPGFQKWDRGRVAFAFYQSRPESYQGLAPVSAARLAITGQLDLRA